MFAGPIDLSHSPHVALRPVPVDAVRLDDAFWSPRLALNRSVTLPAQLRHLEETGRIANFRRASGKIAGAFQGQFAFNDSDVYKWAEAASWSLATHPDPNLDADLDAVITEIADAQQANGYVNTYFMFEREAERYTNLKDLHEMYCAGHLIQAAVAHHRATGKTALLDVAIRLADHLDAVFGPGRRVGACGHEECEMALVELYRTTDETRYLTLAHRMIEARGRTPGLFGNGNYYQDHLPFVAQAEMTGHAVRHLYLCCGAADVCAELDIPAYRDALDALWRNFTTRRMYVTGGAGARHEGEAFGEDYELPNARAYAETCAAIGSVMWNWRMLNMTGEAQYADLMEHALYNAVLPGLSLDGTTYFYENPLADDGKHRRKPWFGCACCPPNVARLLASLPGYFYSTSEDGVYAHLYAASKATIPTPDGGTVEIEQKTEYPWNGRIEFVVKRKSVQAQFLYVRIPFYVRDDFDDGVTLEVDGVPTINAQPGTYARVPLNASETLVAFSLRMEVEYLRSHPHVLNNRERVALQRGPLIYCIEQADHPDMDVRDAMLDEFTAGFRPEFVPDLLDGVTVLRGEGMAAHTRAWDNRLYASSDTFSRLLPSDVRPVAITAIPYYAWANREAGPMLVWLPAA